MVDDDAEAKAAAFLAKKRKSKVEVIEDEVNEYRVMELWLYGDVLLWLLLLLLY